MPSISELVRKDQELLADSEVTQGSLIEQLAAAIRVREAKRLAYETSLSAWQAANKRVGELENKFAVKHG